MTDNDLVPTDATRVDESRSTSDSLSTDESKALVRSWSWADEDLDCFALREIRFFIYPDDIVRAQIRHWNRAHWRTATRTVSRGPRHEWHMIGASGDVLHRFDPGPQINADCTDNNYWYIMTSPIAYPGAFANTHTINKVRTSFEYWRC